MKVLDMFFPKKMLGIDVGTSSVKIVEVSRWGGGKTLENYGQIFSGALYKEPFRTFDQGTYQLSDYFISRAVKAILDEARIKTRSVVFCVPDFSTFCLSLDLPPMTEKEIPDAIKYNASQYIPLPVTETVFDWRVVAGKPGDKHSGLKVFLIAIPNQVVQEYQKVAQAAGLQLYALEAEVLGIARSLSPRDKSKTACIIDLGVQSATVNIVSRGALEKSCSLNFSSGQLNYVISSALGVSRQEAENIKIKEGLLSSRQNITEAIYLLLDSLILEIKKVLVDFSQTDGRSIDQILLTGGTANMPGLREYFSEVLKTNIEIPNCFSDTLYPPILEDKLQKMSPSFSAAMGVALGALEKN